ncbi:2-isopropylmalate/homocitrate/Re-citrate synthase [Dehalococcoides mccartyi]|uniref:2-isopropylmalate/homocitrate/Re-citrate synthase n=1 Tax=Dehalococcoides mccartyi TaxID=61435 RepID=A0A142VC32_9CHLR|nr:2-isopropylmalate/homocitrate/Re-citrate synthase [Dehalococcoides mccartyi]
MDTVSIGNVNYENFSHVIIPPVIDALNITFYHSLLRLTNPLYLFYLLHTSNTL